MVTTVMIMVTRTITHIPTHTLMTIIIAIMTTAKSTIARIMNPGHGQRDHV